MEPPAPSRRVQRIRHELRRRDVEVVRVEAIGPHFAAATFGGGSLADFVSASFDDHVKFMFPAPDGEVVRRDYTPRRFDAAACELTIEFALHGDGPAARWARTARVGQRAVVAGPRGSMIIPMDYDWQLLAGDAAALPAIHRRVEELPPGARAIVVAQVDEADRRELRSAANLDLRWVASAEELLAAIHALALPAGEGHAWAAGEAGTMAQLRRVLIEDRHHPKESMRVAAYWKRGAAEYHEAMDR